MDKVCDCHTKRSAALPLVIIISESRGLDERRRILTPRGGLVGWAEAYKEILRTIKNLEIGGKSEAGSHTVDSSWAKDAINAKKGKKKG